jgi:hypothetical protein
LVAVDTRIFYAESGHNYNPPTARLNPPSGIDGRAGRRRWPFPGDLPECLFIIKGSND